MVIIYLNLYILTLFKLKYYSRNVYTPRIIILTYSIYVLSSLYTTITTVLLLYINNNFRVYRGIYIHRDRVVYERTCSA